MRCHHLDYLFLPSALTSPRPHLPLAPHSIIFSTLVDWWMKKFSYQPHITKLSRPLVAATLEVYELAQRELLPTPQKSHYTFNLRDVSKVFQVRAACAGEGAQGGHMRGHSEVPLVSA